MPYVGRSRWRGTQDIGIIWPLALVLSGTFLNIRSDSTGVGAILIASVIAVIAVWLAGPSCVHVDAAAESRGPRAAMLLRPDAGLRLRLSSRPFGEAFH